MLAPSVESVARIIPPPRPKAEAKTNSALIVRIDPGIRTLQQRILER
jgi:hypothetical protein